MLIIERLCERYLARRGRVVLPLAFRGVTFGNCYVETLRAGIYRVVTPLNGTLIALNHSVVYRHDP